MADEKIQLHFSGKYTAGDAFTQANTDIKDYQKAHKDMIGAAKNGLSSLAGAFDGELSGSIKRTYSVLQQIANGGIWGIMSAAVSEMVGYFKRCSEEAEELKKRMDDMRAGSQRLLQDQAAAAEAMKQKDLDDLAKKAEVAVKAVDKLSASFRGLAAAEDASIGAAGQIKIAQINDEFSKQLAEACDELRPLVEAERNLAVATQQQATAREQQTLAIEREKVALAEIEQKIALQKKAIEAEAAAGHDTSESYKALSFLNTELSAQTLRLKTAQSAAELSALRHETSVRDATAAVKKAQIAWDKAVEANEKENEKVEDLAYLHAQQEKITRICMKNQVDWTSYIKLFSDSLEKGLTESEAYAELQKKLNDDLKKRADAEEKAAKEAEKKKNEEQKAFAQAVLHIDPNEVKEGVQDWDGETTWSKMRDKLSEDVKHEHQEQKRMRAELQPFMQLLKGNMPKQFREEYERMLMTNYSKEQIQEMYEKAMKSQMLSLSEQKSQKKTFESMLQCMEKAGLK
jgi:hypothetical protein